MSDDIDNLERLRVAAQSHYLAPDLGQWAVRRIEQSFTSVQREAAAVRLVRAAGALIGGSAYRQANALAAMAAQIRSASELDERFLTDESEACRLICRAMAINPAMGISTRQLQRLL